MVGWRAPQFKTNWSRDAADAINSPRLQTFEMYLGHFHYEKMFYSYGKAIQNMVNIWWQCLYENQQPE